jgi:hypothetical protein
MKKMVNLEDLLKHLETRKNILQMRILGLQKNSKDQINTNHEIVFLKDILKNFDAMFKKGDFKSFEDIENALKKGKKIRHMDWDEGYMYFNDSLNIFTDENDIRMYESFDEFERYYSILELA